MRFLAGFLAVGALALPKAVPESGMSEAAQAFISTLSGPLKAKAVLPLDSPVKTTWTYVPGERKGVSWAEMDERQKTAGLALLKASLSAEGYDKVARIRSLEAVLQEMENNPSRDSEKYWFMFFGEPSANGTWLWRYEGHHVSLTFAHTGGMIVSSTPQFLGSNPAEVKSGPRKGERILDREQDLGFRLVESLTPEQRKKAVLADEAPGDIVTASSRKAGIEGHQGLAFREMDEIQRAHLRALLEAHAAVQSKAERERRLKAVEKDGYDKVVFAWLGPVRRDARHYYRIQSESFVVEYDNTQADGNHIHTVWRDFKGDFGEDALADHYAHGHYHH